MNKIAKASIAGAAGVILLMGGAGSLAYWNNTAALGASTSINAGQLNAALSGSGVWKSGSTTINLATFKAVPGDVLTYTQNYTVDAKGDNLLFTVGVTPGTITATNSATSADVALKNALTQSAAFSVSGGNVVASTTPGTYKLSSNTGPSTIAVTLTVTFPNPTSVDNTTQQGNVSLAAGAVTLAQTTTP